MEFDLNPKVEAVCNNSKERLVAIEQCATPGDAELGKRKGHEAAIGRMDEIVDRQLNKASGLLTFNGILIAALSVGDVGKSNLALIPIVAAIVSSGLTLEMLLSHW